MSLTPLCRHVVLAVAGLIALLQAASAAQQPAPADASTPRGALKALTVALDAGDEAAMRRLIAADSPEQQAWADAMIGFSVALSKVRAQAEATFGAEAARAIVGDTAAATAAAMQQIDQSTEELDGDRATVRSATPEDRPLVVRRAPGGGGAWVVPVAAITGDAKAEEFPPVTERLRRQAAAVQSVTAEIASGALATPEQAAQALQRRQFEARVQADQPPAGAATRPAASTQRADG